MIPKELILLVMLVIDTKSPHAIQPWLHVLSTTYKPRDLFTYDQQGYEYDLSIHQGIDCWTGTVKTSQGS